MTLECSALGGPQVSFQWQSNGTDLMTQTNSMLNLSSVDASTGGEYTCGASNTAGNSSAITSVFIAPYLVVFPEPVFNVQGSSPSIACMAEAFPSPSYQWIKVKNTIRSDIMVRMRKY